MTLKASALLAAADAIQTRMARSTSRRVIYAALGGNLLVAMTKFVAASLTGSAAMLSEAIHSTVDSGNQLLLLLGMRRAARPANTRHPFGHGLQLYFWTFVVAVLIFGVGAGVSVVEGISKIRTLHPVESPWVNYLVLGLALLFECAVLDRGAARLSGDKGLARLTRSRAVQQGPHRVHGVIRGHGRNAGPSRGVCRHPA